MKTNDCKVLSIWLTVNKNGSVLLHTSEPRKNEDTGKWESDNLYCNSVLYEQMKELVKNSGMGWNSEPEQFEIKVGAIKL